MKFSIKNLIGIMIFISLIVIILRRPLAEGLFPEPIWHAIAAPYYYDLYAFNLESLWPFEGSVIQKQNDWDSNNGKGVFIFLPLAFSFIISIILHCVGAVYASLVISDIFFTEKKVEEQQQEEEEETDDES